jgi:hypothetical protein
MKGMNAAPMKTYPCAPGDNPYMEPEYRERLDRLFPSLGDTFTISERVERGVLRLEPDFKAWLEAHRPAYKKVMEDCVRSALRFARRKGPMRAYRCKPGENPFLSPSSRKWMRFIMAFYRSKQRTSRNACRPGSARP